MNECFSVEEAQALISDPRYIIDAFIGGGAMGCVYRVRERGTPNIYALKLLREQYVQRTKFVDFFEREATHMRDLQYPNIVRFYKFIRDERSAYILMDYVDGKPLTYDINEARATGQQIPIEKIVIIMAQIARALNYLHREGFIHRDVKPGNILLAGNDESTFLTDFGIVGASMVDDPLLGGGTLPYMPYEQHISSKVNHTVDIYAFAVTLFEMMTNRLPFQIDRSIDRNDARVAFRALHQFAPIPAITGFRADLPDGLNQYFQKAFAKKPDDRYQDILDFAQDIHGELLPQLPLGVEDFDMVQANEMKKRSQINVIEKNEHEPSLIQRVKGMFEKRTGKTLDVQDAGFQISSEPQSDEFVEETPDYEITTVFNDYGQFSGETVSAKKHDIFISYSRKDIEMKQKIQADLQKAGFNVWTDERLEPGMSSWSNELEDAIRFSKTIVVLMSPDSKMSEWVQIEVTTAKNFDVKIFPLFIRGKEAKDSTLMPLVNYQRIDFRNDYNKPIKELILALGRYIGTY